MYHPIHNHPKEVLTDAAILNSNSRELTVQLFPRSYFLLKCLCKILWQHGGGGSPSYLLFFKCNYKLPNDLHFMFIIVFQIYPHEPLAVGVEVT